MKTDQELARDIIQFAIEHAQIIPEGLSRPILTGEKVNTVNADPLHRYLTFLNVNTFRLAQILNVALANGDYDDTEDDAVKIFQYIFDRTVEVNYLAMNGEPYENICLDVDEIGCYYELSLPDHIQLQINRIVPNIVLLAGEIYRFMQGNEYVGLSFARWINLYMSAAVSIAMQYILEIELL